MYQSDYNHLYWHDAAWQALWRASAGMPHALLLTGPAGIGKHVFAMALAARLLCEAPTPSGACGACPSCRWLAAGNHPDFRYLCPQVDAETEGDASAGERKKASRYIRIDQVRELEDFVFIGSHRGGARVVIIEPAEAMNTAAQNALLKILEEPTVNIYFLLINSRIRSLLPTILSRCRIMKLAKPRPADASAWLARHTDGAAVELLAMTGGAPLVAMAESQAGRAAAYKAIVAGLAEPGGDPSNLASQWERQLQLKDEAGVSMERLVDIVQKWVFDLVQQKLAGRNRYFQDRARTMETLAGPASAGNLIRCYNELVKMRALVSHPLNPKLYLEELAQRYVRALSGGRAARG